MPASQEAAKIAKAVLEGVIESTVGTDPGSGYVKIPVYDVGPLVTPSVETTDLNPALDELAAGPIIAGPGTYLFGFKNYMYGSATNVGLEPWQVVLLPACGMLGGVWGGSAAPGAPSVAAGASTGLTGDYGYKVTTYDKATGIESEVSIEDTVVGLSNESVDVTVANVDADQSVFIYRTVANAETVGPWYFCGGIDGNGGGGNLVYSDSLPDAELDTGRVPPTGASAGYQWLPLSEGFKAATLRGNLDGHRRVGVGSRGSFREVGAAGRSTELNWEIQTKMGTTTLKLNNPTGAVYPSQPPKLVSANDFLRPKKGDFTVAANGTPNALGTNLMPWCLKRYEFTPGTQVRPRRCASASEGIREYSIHQRYQQELTLVFETPKGSATADDAFDPVADMKAGVIFNASFQLGSTTLARIRRTFPALQLLEAPVFVDEDEGIRCYSGRFRPLSMFSNDWHRILQF